MQADSGLAQRIRRGPLPGLVREQDQYLGIGKRLVACAHGHEHAGGIRLGGGRRQGDAKVHTSNQLEPRQPPGEFAGLSSDDGDAVAAALHDEQPATGPLDAAGRHPAEDRSKDLVARRLPVLQLIYGQTVGQGSGRLYLHPVGKHGQANPAAAHRIVAVGHRIGDRLEQGLGAVLWQIHASRILVGPDAHVAHGEGDRFGDLPVEGAADRLGVELAGGPVGTAVVGGRDAGVGQPFLRCVAAEEEAGDGGPHRAMFVAPEKARLLQGRFRVGPAFGAQQRLPERFVQRSRSRAGHGLLVEPQEPRLAAPLGQTQPLVARHSAL